MSYTDVFGGNTVPPSRYAYKAYTYSANVAFHWPDNYTGANTLSEIVEITATVVDLEFNLPKATEVSTGRNVLFRNLGANTFTINDYDDGTVTTVAAGEAKYVYLKDNNTDAGTWTTIAYGAGASTVDAAALVGYGVKAISSSLNQAHPIVSTATNYTVVDDDRASLVLFTGGSGTIYLPSAYTVGADWFCFIRNSGSGSVQIEPYGTQTIDSLTTMFLNPGESFMLCSSGTAWFTVGYGRATEFNFTQLTKDVTAGGTFVLTAAEAANKLLTFVGTPSLDYTVVVPSTVQVYYIHNDISSVASISVTVKTAAGTGVEIEKGQRLIVFCDSVNVYSAASTDSYTTIINVGDSGYVSARYVYKVGAGGTTTIPVPYSGYISEYVYLNGSLQNPLDATGVTPAYTTEGSGSNTIFTFAETLNEDDIVYFVMNFLADLSRESFIEQHVFTATSGQTTFTWSSATFVSTDVLVFVNGSKQAQSYALNGSSVIFDTGLNSGDIVDVTLVQNVQSAVTQTEPIMMMKQTISTNTIIPTGYNAFSVDPTIDAVVTVSAGSVWAIVGE
jgi:hypothetical protein